MCLTYITVEDSFFVQGLDSFFVHNMNSFFVLGSDCFFVLSLDALVCTDAEPRKAWRLRSNTSSLR
jgi:hypothetical protein